MCACALMCSSYIVYTKAFWFHVVSRDRGWLGSDGRLGPRAVWGVHLLL